MAGLNQMAEGDPDARENLILDLRYVVKVVVGRFLFYWPVTARFTDEMVSEGFQTITKVVDTLDDAEDFLGVIWRKVAHDIEKMLNDLRAIASPSKATNFRRTKEGLEPEYMFAKELQEEIDYDSWDDGQEWVDMIDEVEYLRAEDAEHIRYLILRHLNDKHGLDEDALTEEEKQSVDTMSRIFGNL
jgi:hypothetical protein